MIEFGEFFPEVVALPPLPQPLPVPPPSSDADDEFGEVWQ